MDEHIVTHPAMLKALVDKVEALGADRIIVGDNPGLFGYGENEDSFKKTGLMDAARGYYKNIGESSKKRPFNPNYMDHVFVSTDIIDADIVISLPKFKPHGLTVLTGAIKGDLTVIPDFVVPPLGGEAISGNKTIQSMMASKVNVRPKADRILCTACGTCIDHCPVQALSMNDHDIPQVDMDRCVTCFCCQEICPEKAIRLG